uniref:Uncharacterized protein n=1 Tax=Rhizophora mucronata TaxID=61149 RepID=A0A2P2IS45_RHIMU
MSLPHPVSNSRYEYSTMNILISYSIIHRVVTCPSRNSHVCNTHFVRGCSMERQSGHVFQGHDQK